MSKENYYAIWNTQQIVSTWDECQQIVRGMSGAKYKKFGTLEEAQGFLRGIKSPKESRSKNIRVLTYQNMSISGTIRMVEDTDPFTLDLKGQIYVVDGSFNPNKRIYGGAFALFDSTKNLLFSSRVSGNKPDFAESRNVAGEVLAFASAVYHATQFGYNEITIVCDYEGIIRWTAPRCVILGGKPCWGITESSPIAHYHANALRYAMSRGLNRIHFIWVRGHRGIDVNEYVDKLAKEAVGVF